MQVLLGATLIDGTGASPVPDAAVLIDGERIVAAGPRPAISWRPDASLIVAARASIAPLFSLVPGVDEVVVLPASGAASLSGCDVALLLPNSFHSALTAARAGIRERWGQAVGRRVHGVHPVPP